ncbi:MAG TPA: hypothetical protein VFB62_03760 [Polyangiaceae bacterium]|nr:hypothetical protein [Polyangiaceae bacterium]
MKLRFIRLGLLALAFILTSGAAFGVPVSAVRARLKILSLELGEAAQVLEGAGDDPEVAVERGRLGLYRGDCDGAVVALTRADLEDHEEGSALLQVAQGCARGTAATVVERDDKNGVVVRFQDDEDRALFPLIADAVARIRSSLEQDLGTRLPSPVFIDLVRDQFTLSALSGLPERAAATTGTVAVAKWGRVMMISPRASPAGYPWLDTLAHEMTHLVVSQATRDRAPLWLQEGVAKRQETRWREATPFDGFPPSDAMAAHGIKKGLALPLTELGPSIAMLPTAEQAAIAFAEVASFVEFFVERAGREALPKLLVAMRDAPAGEDEVKAIKKVSGLDLGEWDTQWRAHLASLNPTLPPEVDPATPFVKGPELARRRRLGELLMSRGHHHAAAHQLEKAHNLLVNEASTRCMLADAWMGIGEELAASELFARPKEIIGPSGRWWSLHDFFMMKDALPKARWWAVANDPLDPRVACNELEGGEYPRDPNAHNLCDAARRFAWLARDL